MSFQTATTQPGWTRRTIAMEFRACSASSCPGVLPLALQRVVDAVYRSADEGHDVVL